MSKFAKNLLNYMYTNISHQNLCYMISINLHPIMWLENDRLDSNHLAFILI